MSNQLDGKSDYDESIDRIMRLMDQAMSKISSETKAGYKPTQLRGPDGRWVRSSMGQRAFKDSIRNQDYETMGAYDKDGNLVFAKEGESDRVGFTDEEIEEMRGLAVVHNHPYPGTGSLSVGDFAAGINMRIGSIKSVAQDGSWAEAVFNYDYIDSIKVEIGRMHGIEADDVGIADMIHQIGAAEQDLFRQRRAFEFLTLNTNAQDEVHRLTRDWGEQLMKSFSEGIKDQEHQWAPMELDKLWTIKTGKDEI